MINLTGNDIFNTAMDLCALRSKTGSVPANCGDLVQRAPALLNLLLAENAYLDALIKKQPISISTVTKLDDALTVSPIICASVLPYGLACLLIDNEDAASAAFFRNKYETERAKVHSQIKATLHSISEVY